MSIYRPFKVIPPLKDEEYNETYSPYAMINSIFAPEELNRINDLWDEERSKEGTISADNRIDYAKRKAKELLIEAQGNEWIYHKIGVICMMMNAGRFKLDITGFRSPLRMVKYEVGDFFDWHMDYGPSKASNRKIVVCIQLSDETDYEGGDLQLMTEKTTASKIKGSAAIFPSYVMHRVTPIISGCRKSLIALIGGPPFK